MEKHTIIRTDKMYGTDNRTGVLSCRLEDTPVDNGSVVVIGSLEAGSREIYQASSGAESAKLGTIALIASPEVLYDERLVSLHNFYNKAGDICRAYLLHEGDIFSLTEEGFEGGAPELDAEVSVSGMKFTTGAASETDVMFKVIDVNNVNGTMFYAIQVFRK